MPPKIYMPCEEINIRQGQIIDEIRKGGLSAQQIRDLIEEYNALNALWYAEGCNKKA